MLIMKKEHHMSGLLFRVTTAFCKPYAMGAAVHGGSVRLLQILPRTHCNLSSSIATYVRHSTHSIILGDGFYGTPSLPWGNGSNVNPGDTVHFTFTGVR